MKEKKLIGDNPNDKVYTPVEVARDIISKFQLSGKVLDPFRGAGAFYDNLPDTVEKDWCEIDDDRNFFDYNEKVNWIISNPPYSIFGEVMQHSYEIADNIVYLIPLNKITSSIPRVRELLNYGGIRYVYVLTPKECGFPFGFAASAVWIQRGYTGPVTVECSEDVKKGV